MKVCNLGSGSRGNCTYLEIENHKILIDAGLTFKDISLRLEFISVRAEDITEIIVSHEHIDHIRAINNFASKFKTKVYAFSGLWETLLSKCPKIDVSQRVAFDDCDFMIGKLKVTPIRVSHDSLSCHGFAFEEKTKKFSILTDLGQTNDRILSCIRNSQLIYLEANHDEKMLMANPNYPECLKKRILSSRGHLSNTDCAEAIAKCITCETKQIVLSHLSEKNNSDDLAFETVCKVLSDYGIIEGKHIRIDIAHQAHAGIVNGTAG
ncbi:MAG: MBL fold metallo-hydrolase, partial [Clostridia bacterium]